jgi:hypothetical protein
MGGIPSDEFGFDLFAILFEEHYEKHVLLVAPSPVFTLSARGNLALDHQPLHLTFV